MSVTFTYTGTLDGHPVTGEVADNQITGNPFVEIQVEGLVRNGVHVGLGPWSGTATLDDENLARATVAAIVEDPSFTPSAPVSAPLPPGAVS